MCFHGENAKALLKDIKDNLKKMERYNNRITVVVFLNLHYKFNKFY